MKHLSNFLPIFIVLALLGLLGWGVYWAFSFFGKQYAELGSSWAAGLTIMSVVLILCSFIIAWPNHKLANRSALPVHPEGVRIGPGDHLELRQLEPGGDHGGDRGDLRHRARDPHRGGGGTRPGRGALQHRARHGAAMNGPDYTWWHGLYEVAKHTYFKFIPELREVAQHKDGNEKFADAMLEKYFKPIEGHDWYFNGLSKDAIDKVRKGFEERYGKGAMK